jgi:hypothetical protein
MNPALSYPASTSYNSAYLNSFYKPSVLATIPALDQQIVPAELLPLIQQNAGQKEFAQYFFTHPNLGFQLQKFAKDIKLAMQYNAQGKNMAFFTIPWVTVQPGPIVLTPNQQVGFYYTVYAMNPNISYMGKIIYFYRMYLKEQTLMRMKVNQGIPYNTNYISFNYQKQFNFY